MRALRIGSAPASPGRPAVFLDRDGVLIENLDGYVRRDRDIRVLLGAAAAVRRIRGLGYAAVVVTNQAMVGKGLEPAEQALSVHRAVLARLAAEGAEIDASYICPHAPEDRCPCRKPEPGMLLQASADLGLDLSASLMVGDARSDIAAARAAGVAPVLVLTGRGARERSAAAPGELRGVAVSAGLDPFAGDLASALSRSAW
jgi:D-glycero-D-manno-heptose 1,7-bisphosphate phosphatase